VARSHANCSTVARHKLNESLLGVSQDDLAVMVGGLGEGALGTVLAILERHHPELYNSDPGDKVNAHHVICRGTRNLVLAVLQ
jgi:hypothetical protein